MVSFEPIARLPLCVCVCVCVGGGEGWFIIQGVVTTIGAVVTAATGVKKF